MAQNTASTTTPTVTLPNMVFKDQGFEPAVHSDELIELPPVKVEVIRGEIPEIPPGWTTLHHASNLVRWQSTDPLTAEHITLQRPLSVLDKQSIDRDRKQQTARYNTMNTYTFHAKPEGMTNEDFEKLNRPLELRILFYDNIRTNRTPEFKAAIADPATKELIEKYYFKNLQQGRHPLVPKNTELVSLAHVRENGRDVIYLIPVNVVEKYQSDIVAQKEV